MTFKDVTEALELLQEEKNNDYGNAFEELCEEFGSIALIYPLSIKIKRLRTLLDGNTKRAVNEESVLDTLIDIMGYAGMGIVAINNEVLKINDSLL